MEVEGRPEDYRREAKTALEQGDWHEAYLWAKGWIGSGGGARSLEPWLVYLASALQQGQPRTAVHSADLALAHWIEGERARAVLHYARGEVIRRHLRDPKTARADLDAAGDAAPAWLADTVAEARAACESEAGTSRKRKPSVGRAPRFSGADMDEPVAADPEVDVSDSPPELWDVVCSVLASDDPRSGRPSA